MKHTKTPWKWGKMSTDMYDRTCARRIYSREGRVASGGECQWEGMIVFDKKEDMDFLLHAANNYDRLIDMLRKVKDDTFPDISKKVYDLLKVIGEE